MSWPTIETAPKDGTSILGWNGDEFCICRWYRQKFHKHPKPYWDLGNGYSEKYARANQPTHWMPIPPPPVVKESLTPALPMDDDLDEPLGPAPTHWMPLPPPPTVTQSLTVPLDDDLDEPLGQACSRENPECEACQ